MKRRWFSFAIAFLPALIVCASCGPASGAGKRYPDYRYRLTVEVDTPEGLKTSSSVIEVSTQKAGKYAIPNAGWVSSRVKGEAVTVDLGKRGTMFALLRSEYNADWASGILFLVARPVTLEEAKAAGLNSDYDPSFDLRMQRTLALKGKHEIPRYVDNVVTGGTARNQGGELPSAYPMLVTFENMDDPKSVARVDSDNLAATFGAGVKLKRITVERTEDAVTANIEKKLPMTFWRSWGANHKREMQGNGGVMKNPYFRSLAGQLNRNDFSTGVSK